LRGYEAGKTLDAVQPDLYPESMPRRRDAKPETKSLPDRLRIKGSGCHRIEDVIAVVYGEMHKLDLAGFTHANGFDVYITLSDKHGRPMTHFPDGRPIAGMIVTADPPYRSAAEEHGL
jgi:hypothetical protein